MKNKPKQNEASAGLDADGDLAPTLFEQVTAITEELRCEAGLVPSERAPQPTMELPPHARNIIKQLRKTILKPVLNLRPAGTIDWRKYGRTIGALERYEAFLEHDLPRVLEEEWGDMTDEQWERIEPKLGLDKIRAVLVKSLNRTVTDDEPLEKIVDEVLMRRRENINSHRECAFRHVAQQSIKSKALFYRGVSEGCLLFMDDRAKFCGDRGRANIQMSLLACMMEVEKIRRTLPPTTRAKFYDKLAKVFKLPPKEYDWFNDVCDDIKFPLNNLGRKRLGPAPLL